MCQLFGDLLQASNFKWAHSEAKSVKYFILNIFLYTAELNIQQYVMNFNV